MTKTQAETPASTESDLRDAAIGSTESTSLESPIQATPSTAGETPTELVAGTGSIASEQPEAPVSEARNDQETGRSAGTPARAPKATTSSRTPTSAKTPAPRARVAASVAKSPTEVVEHVGPKVPIDASQIPPVPPLPVVPPVPPLPVHVTPESGSDETSADVGSVARVPESAHDKLDAEVDVPPAETMEPPKSEADDRPPLPEISAEEAALQFETMPDAAEQATGLENHEPMKFVWSKKWPFLSLVPVSSASDENPTAPARETDAGTERSDDDLFVDSDVAEPETAQPFEEQEFVGNDVYPDESPEKTAVIESLAVTEPMVPEADWTLVNNEPTDSADSATEVFRAYPEADVFPDATTAELPTELSETNVFDGDDFETALLDQSTRDDDLDRTGTSPVVLSIRDLSRSFGDTVAVDGIDLEVREGSFYGIVGPNGAGKTTTLSMITGLLRPDSGHITVHGIDVWENPDKAKRAIGVLPDRLRLFDRLTGAQLLYYSGVLRGLDGATVRSRVKDLAAAFGLEDALNRLVTDYSAGMTKKVALACAMIHSPRLLVLDEPFESVDPVSAANVIEILQKYVAHGGTVVLSSHGMDLIQRVCDHVAIVVNGQVLAAGAVDDVRGSGTLEDRFVELAGGRKAAEGMEWLHSFSD
ncbi:ATP-binding cassette domain-containing protein [Mycetocola zhadangensis]|nr:ATP-binding cassette domain-containing protein [Mycetocola zhadangensis]